jgi:hypothetical protein
MKRAAKCFGVILFLNCFSIIHAQDTSSSIIKKYQEHPWTLEFGVSGNFTLTSFDGAVISMGKYISDHEKIRVGIHTAYSYRKTENESNFNSGDTLTVSNRQAISNANGSAMITLQYLIYETPYENIGVYFGIGPVIGIALSYPQANSTYKQYTVGLLGSFGAEWFLSNKISLHAEYGLSAMYRWYKSEATQSNSKSSTTNTLVDISGESVLFGLSVHF